MYFEPNPMKTFAIALVAASILVACGDDNGNDATNNTSTRDTDLLADAGDVQADTMQSDVDDDIGEDASGREDTGGQEDAGEQVPTWTGEVAPMLANYGCSSGYCHGGGSGGLDWGSAEATYDELVGVTSSADGGCSDLARVAAGDSANSLLYQKLAGTHDCGDQMPPSGGSFSTVDLETVRAWIDRGAPLD